MPTDSAAPPRLLEVAHIAHRLSASDQFVRRLLRGEIGGQRLEGIHVGKHWRIDPRELEAYLDRCRTAERPVRS